MRELRAEVSGLRRKLAAAKVVAKDAQRRGALESGANHAQTLQVRRPRLLEVVGQRPLCVFAGSRAHLGRGGDLLREDGWLASCWLLV